MSPAGRRATVLVLVGVVVAVACTLLGRWQWERHVWRDGAIAVVETNWSAAPVPLDTALPSPEAPLTDAAVWQRVTVVGHYETDGTVLLRNRPVDGTPAYHVLVPFVVEDASAGTTLRRNPRTSRNWLRSSRCSSQASHTLRRSAVCSFGLFQSRPQEASALQARLLQTSSSTASGTGPNRLTGGRPGRRTSRSPRQCRCRDRSLAVS